MVPCGQFYEKSPLSLSENRKKPFFRTKYIYSNTVSISEGGGAGEVVLVLFVILKVPDNLRDNVLAHNVQSIRQFLAKKNVTVATHSTGCLDCLSGCVDRQPDCLDCSGVIQSL